MQATTAQEVKRVPTSAELLHPGDFVFIPKREPIRSFESVSVSRRLALFVASSGSGSGRSSS
jgi:hypothetical protein